MRELKHSQMIAIGVFFLFVVPIIVGLVAGHFLDFWFGVTAGVLTLLFIVWLAQRWMKRTKKND